MARRSRSRVCTPWFRGRVVEGGGVREWGGLAWFGVDGDRGVQKIQICGDVDCVGEAGCRGRWDVGYLWTGECRLQPLGWVSHIWVLGRGVGLHRDSGVQKYDIVISI
jgi:hypothetical protein